MARKGVPCKGVNWAERSRQICAYGGTPSVFSFRASLTLVFSAALIAAPALASRTTQKASTTSSAHRSSTGTHGRSSRKSLKRVVKSHKLHGQQAIDPERATMIQQALIREHYMTGEANGNWDATTQAAMQKYQSDHGWQTRLMPDSRALKSLGLGPDYSSAINAEGASFAPPAPPSTIPAAQTAGFAAAAGVNQ